jgi:hypothetical protein
MFEDVLSHGRIFQVCREVCCQPMIEHLEMTVPVVVFVTLLDRWLMYRMSFREILFAEHEDILVSMKVNNFKRP